MANVQRTDFEEIRKVHTAIKDIDRIYDTEDIDRLDDIWNMISDIDKKNFDQKYVEIIYHAIRDSLVQIYYQLINGAEADIGLEKRSTSISAIETYENTRSINPYEDVEISVM